MRPKTISKILSSNDTGETGGHQAGMLVPRGGEILSFFPSLDPSIKNPRTTLSFEDTAGRIWSLHFIYYNNRLFGGTRNEYRLTGMTTFFRQNNLKTGDLVTLSRDDNEDLFISYERQHIKQENAIRHQKIILSGNWKVINY